MNRAVRTTTTKNVSKSSKFDKLKQSAGSKKLDSNLKNKDAKIDNKNDVNILPLELGAAKQYHEKEMQHFMVANSKSGKKNRLDKISISHDHSLQDKAAVVQDNSPKMEDYG